MSKYIQHFPKPLLDDLVGGRWLPVIGAGMSRNAVVPRGKQMPLWDDLGRQLAVELADYPYTGALDAISAYSHEYGRPRLVERLAEALLINDARPGEAHRAFCSILFDVVCTTNLDFLLERQYEAVPRYCRPVIDEDHLVINARDDSTLLLKLHGDVHHPSRLVVTEDDYDCFLDRYPLLATYLANLLITRTAVLVGYSLDDPDFRQVWQVIADRLGRARRLAYAIVVDAKSTDVARFARRGVKVISLPGARSKYSQILSRTFDELREYLQTNVISVSYVTEEEPLAELTLPKEAVTRLCFFALPLSLHPVYRDQVFPLAERAGLVPVTATEVVAPGENFAAKIDAIIRRSVAAVVDASSQNTIFELGMLSSLKKSIPTLVIVEKDSPVPSDIGGIEVLYRGKPPFLDQEDFLRAIEGWFGQIAAGIRSALAEEPSRLLKAREYRAAVISAITYLEHSLRRLLDVQELRSRAFSFYYLIGLAKERGLITSEDEDLIRQWAKVRNLAVHSELPVTRATAVEIVKGVMRIAEGMRQAG